MIELPFVSVIVPVWNSSDLIGKCLTALAGQDYPRDRFEVIVVDNGSTDDSVEVVRSFAGVRLLVEPEPGSYRARNVGLKAATGEYVAFTDADCVPDIGWLSGLVDAVLSHPEAGIVAGKIELFAIDGDGWDACMKYERIFAFNQERNVRWNFCVTASWLSPRQFLSGLGGFRDDLRSGGDTECSRRVAATGRSVVYAPGSITRHPARSRFDALMNKRRRVVGGRVKTRRHSPAKLGMILVAETGRDIIRAGRAVEFSWLDRFKVSLVTCLLGIISVIEMTRVACGGAPRRS